MCRNERLQSQAFIQLANQNETGIRGDARPLERDLQKAIEGELKGLGFFLTHRVSPFVARFPASEPRKARLDACSAGQGTTTKSEIRGETSACMHPFARQLLSWHPSGDRPRSSWKLKAICATTSAGF